MKNTPDRNITHETAIFNLWLNWIVACGALVLPNLVSVYTPAITVPLVTFLLAGLLSVYNHTSLRSRSAVCPLLPTIAIRSLVMSGIIMIGILISYTRGIVDQFFETELLNRQIPFLTVLIISPVTLTNVVWAMLRGHRYEACRKCRVLLGTETERGFIGSIFAQESRYQRSFLLAITAVLTLTSWAYYTSFYINVNINVPDKFFLGWVPVIFYLISIVYLATRYFTIWAYYYQTIESNDRVKGSSTIVRYLVISGDSIFLSRNDEFYDVPDSSRFDTPALLAKSYQKEVSLDAARTTFANISQIPSEGFDLRFMYYSEDSTGAHNIFHYICCLPDKSATDGSMFRGKWYNLSQLERLLHNRELSPMLAAEIHRLYTVAMAWKTYDAEGRRLYKVKNYRPVFRLNGICQWDVDFNSSLWLKVSQLNEDKPFFRLRRLLSRMGGGDSL